MELIALIALIARQLGSESNCLRLITKRSVRLIGI